MTGPLARYAEGFREELSGRGYTQGSRRIRFTWWPISAAGSRRKAWIRRRWMSALSASSLRRAALALPFTSRTSVSECPVFGTALRVGHDRGWRSDGAVNATRPLL